MKSVLKIFTATLLCHIYITTYSIGIDVNSGDLIWSNKQTNTWSEGYPIGNGRIGGMVLGNAKKERIALNHDLLWRNFWDYQNHNTASDMPEIISASLNGEWDILEEKVLAKVSRTGKAIYVNPYVPVGDLFIDMDHSSTVTAYQRTLNMQEGIVEISYDIGEVSYKREVFVSWEQGIMVIRLSSNRMGMLSGEVSLSRLLDPECKLRGYSELDKLVMEGEFEEGRKFSFAAKVIQRGGRLTGGNRKYEQPFGDGSEKDLGLSYTFNQQNETTEKGPSTYFDSSNEVLILIAINVDQEFDSNDKLAEQSINKLNSINTNYDLLKNEHIANHQRFYNRVRIDLSKTDSNISTDSLLKYSIKNNTASPELIEKMFNMSRYLAISSGTPQKNSTNKAPINLQGIWNQDRRPAWDSDYHLDMNIEMCYWPLDMMNLGELLNPLMDWAEKLIPQGRIAARDLYGCKGIYYPPTCDFNNIGNVDNIGFYWSGGASWIAQILWQHWEYDQDPQFLKDRLLPFMKEIALFYKDFLVENENGDLIPPLSTSPEMPIAGRKYRSFASSPSTMDLELIRDLLSHLIHGATILEQDKALVHEWETMLQKIPYPIINEEGILTEWMEYHQPGDPGHRHRSQFVGLCPGDRISVEATPKYAEAAYLALKERHSNGMNMTQSMTFVWDAQILARLYKPKEAFSQITKLIPIHVLDNLLITCNDWGGKGGLAWFPGVKLFQIEANIGLASSIIEMIFQDRQGSFKFLPALPKELSEGKVSGLRARGGFLVDINWSNSKVDHALIQSIVGNVCKINIKGKLSEIEIVSEGNKIPYQIVESDDTLTFKTEIGKQYLMKF